MPAPNRIELLQWDASGLDLLRAMNTPAQKLHLGGPETAEKILDRHTRYLTYHVPGETEMLRVSANGGVVGSVGYWAIERRGEAAYEVGWEMLESAHGRGIGTAAARALVERLRPVSRHRFVYAFPTPDNAGSNGICRKLGFGLIATEQAEYPKGVWGPHNVWQLDLNAWPPRPA